MKKYLVLMGSLGLMSWAAYATKGPMFQEIVCVDVKNEGFPKNEKICLNRIFSRHDRWSYHIALKYKAYDRFFYRPGIKIHPNEITQDEKKMAYVAFFKMLNTYPQIFEKNSLVNFLAPIYLSVEKELNKKHRYKLNRPYSDEKIQDALCFMLPTSCNP